MRLQYYFYDYDMFMCSVLVNQRNSVVTIIKFPNAFTLAVNNNKNKEFKLF